MNPTIDTGMEPLVLCEDCLNGRMYRFDFNRRCCRARHSLSLDKSMRTRKYEHLSERYGEAEARAHIADVKALHQWRIDHGMSGAA